jgi:cytochrome c biogenesis protein CcdA/glutaredoxin
MINFKLVKTLSISVFLLAVSVFFALRAQAVFAADAAGGAAAEEKIEIIFFHSETCPHCKAEKVFLDKLAEKYPDLTIAGYEISIKDNQRLYEDCVKRYNVAYGVPLTVIGDKPILGYLSEQTTGKEIEDMVDALRKGEDGPDKSLRTGFSILGWNFTIDPESPLPLLAVIFGLADGINPCMFSVLMMLLAYLITSGSARRAVISGILFGVSVFLIYFLMMAGIYESLSFFGENLTQLMIPLKMFLGWVFVAVGIWMAKDFFFLKEGQKVSFAIPRMAHPLIKKLVRQSSFMAVILLALFSSLVELPCTFALPLGYVAILAARGAAAYPYILLYNLFFVLPLFFIVGAVGLGFSRVSRLEEWRERSKKTMRLVSGLLLFLLGMAFLFKIF